MKAIIFDWGRTLYDKDNERLFPETLEVLDYCQKKYRLALVSLATDNDIEGRFEKMDRFGLRKYFDLALFHPSDKVSIARNALAHLQIPCSDIVVVDDRIKRMGWAISRGCKTIWIQKGKFAHEEPDETTGYPTHRVSSLQEILSII